MVGDGKIFVSDIQETYRIRTKKRNGCYQQPTLIKKLKKIYYGYECCIRLNVGINLRNFSVFSCKQVLPCRNWIYKIKKHWEYNNEKFNGFCIGSVGFWAIGYP
jgi:hypothetical protein